jgi:dynein intermediate chain 1
MQWIIYDTYQQDFEAQQREKEKDKKDKVVPIQKPEMKRKDLEVTSDITSRTLLAMKTLERMINQNTFDEIAQGMSCRISASCKVGKMPSLS